MKFIIERSGEYTQQVFQLIEVEADTPEQAQEIAEFNDETDNRIRVVDGDELSQWHVGLDDIEVGEAIEAEDYWRIQQIILGTKALNEYLQYKQIDKGVQDQSSNKTM